MKRNYQLGTNALNGLKVYYSNSAAYIPLVRETWASCGKCVCDHCKGGEGFWDTLVVPFDGSYTWTVHMPELQTMIKLPEWLSYIHKY